MEGKDSAIAEQEAKIQKSAINLTEQYTELSKCKLENVQLRKEVEELKLK